METEMSISHHEYASYAYAAVGRIELGYESAARLHIYECIPSLKPSLQHRYENDTIVDVFEEVGALVSRVGDGVYEVYFNGVGSSLFLDVLYYLSPFVRDGSYIECVGSDNEIWAYGWSYGKMFYQDGRVMYSAPQTYHHVSVNGETVDSGPVEVYHDYDEDNDHKAFTESTYGRGDE